MNYSSYPFTLDIHGGVSQISFPVSLHDTARTLLISLTDGGKPYTIADGCRAVISAVKADGTHLLNDCITVGNKIIRYDFTPQTAAAVGKVDCEVRLYGEDGNLVTSPRFTIVVYEGLIDERIVSEDEKTSIDRMLASEQQRVAAELAREEAEVVRNETMRRAEAAADRVAQSVNGDNVYIRYAAYADGTGYVAEWRKGLNYIGVAVGLEEPTDKSGYEWSVFAPNIYVGSGEMPDYADIQIDPDSEDVDYVVVQETGDSMASVMSQKATTKAIEKVKGACSNPLKGSATGSAVRMDDVSPITHDMAVKVSGVEDVSAVKVQRYGKNLVNADTVLTGLGYVKQEDGSYYGYPFSPTNIYENVNRAEGAFTISYEAKAGVETAASSPITFKVDYTDGTTGYIGRYLPAGMDTAKYKTITGTTDATKIVRSVTLSYATPKVPMYVRDLMLTYGSTATEHEPYIAPTEYTVNPDGTVDGVTSLSTTTTLMTDTEGAVIDVEYNRDLNKAFAELWSVVDALVGG